MAEEHPIVRKGRLTTPHLFQQILLTASSAVCLTVSFCLYFLSLPSLSLPLFSHSLASQPLFVSLYPSVFISSLFRLYLFLSYKGCNLICNLRLTYYASYCYSFRVINWLQLLSEAMSSKSKNVCINHACKTEQISIPRIGYVFL